MSGRRRLTIRYPDRASVTSAFRTQGAQLTLFVPTTESARIGESVVLDVEFGDCEDRYQLTGRVVGWKASARGFGSRGGLGIGFGRDEKWPVAQMIAMCAGRPVGRGTASEDRVPVRLGCLVKAGGRRYRGEVLDLSLSGLFVALRSSAPVRAGQSCEVQLEPKWLGFLGKWLRATVVWTGDKHGRPGFGARFAGGPELYAAITSRYLPGSGQEPAPEPAEAAAGAAEEPKPPESSGRSDGGR